MGTVFAPVGRGAHGRPVSAGKWIGGMAMLMLLSGQSNGMAQQAKAQKVAAPVAPVAAPTAMPANPPHVANAAVDGWTQQSAQLLLLATQLKQEVDKTTENILSVKVIEKARQIERFTHTTEQQLKAAN